MESNRLSKEARRRFLQAEEGDATIYLSTISIIEILYLLEKGKIPASFWDLLHLTLRPQTHGSYQLVDIDYKITLKLKEVPRESVPELPDRVIAATTLQLNCPLITCDDRLQKWEGIQTIW